MCGVPLVFTNVVWAGCFVFFPDVNDNSSLGVSTRGALNDQFLWGDQNIQMYMVILREFFCDSNSALLGHIMTPAQSFGRKKSCRPESWIRDFHYECESMSEMNCTCLVVGCSDQQRDPHGFHTDWHQMLRHGIMGLPLTKVTQEKSVVMILRRELPKLSVTQTRVVTFLAHLMFVFNTPLKLNSEFAPEKVTKSQSKSSLATCNQPTIFQGRAVKLRQGKRQKKWPDTCGISPLRQNSLISGGKFPWVFGGVEVEVSFVKQ